MEYRYSGKVSKCYCSVSIFVLYFDHTYKFILQKFLKVIFSLLFHLLWGLSKRNIYMSPEIARKPLKVFSKPHCTKKEVFIKNFFSKCDQVHKKLRIWPHLLKKSVIENFIFFVVPVTLVTYMKGLSKKRLLSTPQFGIIIL